MKKLSIFFVSLITTISVLAQYTYKSVVTITVYGNKNLQITVDGIDHNPYDNAGISNKTIIEINDLESGQHTLDIIRTSQQYSRSEKISTIFNLRRRYNMLINVNANGSLELIEKLKSRNYGSRLPMNNADFTNILNNVKYQRTTPAKRTLIKNAFNNTNNFFSTSQVVQLLQQVNSEMYRLELAKLSYRTVTDRNNFTRVYYLLNSQNSRDDLDAFVNNYYEEDNFAEAMSEASFNNLFETIQQQWPVSTQMNSLTNAFNNINHYFTAYQASRLIQLVLTESYRLQLAKLSYRSITDRDNFNLVYDLLNSLNSRNELEYYVANYQEGGHTAFAMSDADFNSLYQSILQQWPVSTQMNSLVNAFNNTNNYFTAYQASRLIQLVGSESNRLRLAKLSYRSITDPANFSQVSDLLGSQASKNELAAYVANYSGGGIGYKVAMPDADFNTLYQNIQFQFLPGGKMTAITNTFNTANYYFTCSQARQLIELVSFESNRLQLAKLSYRTITDRANFSQLFDLLSSQASRDELQAYVNAYVD